MRKDCQKRIDEAYEYIGRATQCLKDGSAYVALCFFGRAAELSEPVFRMYEHRCDWNENQESKKWKSDWAALGEAQEVWEIADDLYESLYALFTDDKNFRRSIYNWDEYRLIDECFAKIRPEEIRLFQGMDAKLNEAVA